MDIYQHLKEAAAKKGFTLLALADTMGITRQALNASMKRPSYTTLEAIAKAMGCDVCDLFASPEDACIGQPNFIAFVRESGVTHTFESRAELLEYLNSTDGQGGNS